MKEPIAGSETTLAGESAGSFCMFVDGEGSLAISLTGGIFGENAVFE
jgi:hypothetical protein